MQQIARIYQRDRLLKSIDGAKPQRNLGRQKKPVKPRHVKYIYNHHFISATCNFLLDLMSWLDLHKDDIRYKVSIYKSQSLFYSIPSIVPIQDFYPKLLNHLVGRIRNPEMADDGSQYNLSDHSEILIVNGRVFDHRTMQVNYTTYDIRREYDIINLSKHSDFMDSASDLEPEIGISSSGHPFAYAHVLGIYHVAYSRPTPTITIRRISICPLVLL